MKYFSWFLPFILFACNHSDNSADGTDTDSSQITVAEDENIEVDPSNQINTEGKTVEYHGNGQIKTIGILDEEGNRQGLWTAYYEDGTKWSESYYVKGILDGHSLTFYPNGQIRFVGEYKMGEKTGTWKFYSETGELTNEENF